MARPEACPAAGVPRRAYEAWEGSGSSSEGWGGRAPPLCTAERRVHRSTWRPTPRVVHRVWRGGPDRHIADLRKRRDWDACDNVATGVTTPVEFFPQLCTHLWRSRLVPALCGRDLRLPGCPHRVRTHASPRPSGV